MYVVSLLSAEMHRIFSLMQEFYQFLFLVLSTRGHTLHSQPFLTTYNDSRHDFKHFKSFFSKKIFEKLELKISQQFIILSKLHYISFSKIIKINLKFFNFISFLKLKVSIILSKFLKVNKYQLEKQLEQFLQFLLRIHFC